MTLLLPPEDEADSGPMPGAVAGAQWPGQDPATVADRWLLQADAAREAGCSVSAIRKWRREGSVSSRKITTPAGLERVQVRAEDVLRRAGRGPARGAVSDASEPGPRPGPGTVLVPVDEFRALLARVAGAEQQAAALENRLRSVDSEARHMRMQLAELSRRIEVHRPRGAPAKAEPERPPPPRRREPRNEVARSLHASPVPETNGAPAPPVAKESRALPRRPPPRPEPDDRPPRRLPPPTFEQWLGDRSDEDRPPAPGPDPAMVVERLRTLYGRLQAWQGREVASATEAEGWLVDLAAYDSALVRACRMLGVDSPYRVGERLPAEARVALTRALAARGADVRDRPGLTGLESSEVQSRESRSRVPHDSTRHSGGADRAGDATPDRGEPPGTRARRTPVRVRSRAQPPVEAAPSAGEGLG